MRNTVTVLLSVLVYVGSSSNASAQDQQSSISRAPRGELQIEIQSPSEDFVLDEGQTTVLTYYRVPII
jgi:hypothetical protein